jgi:hypothetical protein
MLQVGVSGGEAIEQAEGGEHFALVIKTSDHSVDFHERHVG